MGTTIRSFSNAPIVQCCTIDIEYVLLGHNTMSKGCYRFGEREGRLLIGKTSGEQRRLLLSAPCPALREDLIGTADRHANMWHVHRATRCEEMVDGLRIVRGRSQVNHDEALSVFDIWGWRQNKPPVYF